MATTLKQWFDRRNAPLQRDFAESLGVTPGMVSRWVHGEEVPAERAPSIERLTGWKVRCETICPGVDWAAVRRRPRR